METVPRSLVLATDLDVLPDDRIVRRDGDHLIVRSPSNPHHWWGNFLIFDDAPQAGDGERWEELFDAAFADAPAVRHRALTWDRPDGEQGAVREFAARGYELVHTVGLIATPREITPHARGDREVEIRALDPAHGRDEALWEGALAVQLTNNDADAEPFAAYEPFVRARQRDLRALFCAGRGAWYVAIELAGGAVVAGCGVVATGPRGRFQAVDTVPSHRRRGIATRLVAQAAADASARQDLRSLVIAADPAYHALGIYESLGFRRRERICGVHRSPV